MYLSHDCPEKCCPLSLSQLPYFSIGQSSIFQSDNTDAAKCFHRRSHLLTHAPDLTVASFRNCDAKGTWGEPSDSCRLRLFAEDFEVAFGKFPERTVRNRLFSRHLIFFLMIEFGMREAIGQNAVIREEEKTGGIFVETADGEELAAKVRWKKISY